MCDKQEKCNLCAWNVDGIYCDECEFEPITDTAPTVDVAVAVYEVQTRVVRLDSTMPGVRLSHTSL